MKILVVIDMQNDFLDGALRNEEAIKIIDDVCSKIEEYKNSNALIFATRDTHYDNYMKTNEGKNLPVPHCIYNTHGWEINDKIKMSLGDAKVFDKPTFGSVELANYLYDNYKENEEELDIELCGVCTDICVISNAMLIKAYLPNSNIVVDARLVRGVTNETHQNALNAMKCCHIKVVGE